ncbi:DUF1203 domain-containing protein [Sphingomonas sp. MAH-20]|uniref:DUF1203 domain-containing protein n=2 Tax=Sphingomonas horti TaxID=2682842 RepID=A0A6I4IZE1_9SPHN|nr:MULTISPECIES: DUF1203 domain-containing protein [Sphingomonas]MBA2918497.1 DUF1203 domain-containing protein [Sphingomonas sp. CGMCC 1.13658]MVO77464.1 DUF1203 domain-containing protein [Sphingomonas horti]
MAYRIEGLDPAPYVPLFALTDAELEERQARQVTADGRPAFPCRATLEDAGAGERLILVNHVSHDVAGPFRSSFAIYVRESAERPAVFRDTLPPVFATRTLTLRAIDGDGMLVDAVLVPGADADAAIRRLFGNPHIAQIHAHYAAPGCFAAKIVRD